MFVGVDIRVENFEVPNLILILIMTTLDIALMHLLLLSLEG